MFGRLPGPAAQASILLSLGCAFWILAAASAVVLIPPNQTVFDLPFGFGPYVREMLTHGGYGDCRWAHCDHASRMPLMVWVIATAGWFSHSVRLAALLKDSLIALTTLLALSWLWLRVRGSRAVFLSWLFIGSVLVLSLPAAKHAGLIGYEESLSLPMLFLLGAGLPLAFLGSLTRADTGRLLIAAVVVAVLLYLLKSSLLLVYGVTVVAALAWAVLNRAKLVAAVAVLSLLAPISWGMHNLATTGRLSIMTSYDGENLFRAWNSDTLAIYPAVEIDRVFDSPRLTTQDGHLFYPSPKKRRRDFPNEWAWNDAGQVAAMSWLRSHPTDTVKLLRAKVGNLLFSIGKTPRQYGPRPEPRRQTELLEAASVTIWLVLGRLAALLLAIALVHKVMRKADVGAVVVVAAMVAAYSAPLIIGFNFERHITTGLVMMLGCLTAMAPGELARWLDPQRTPMPVT